MTHLRTIVLTASLATAPAAAQSQLWLRQFGTPEHERARAVAADGQGGAFTAGHTDGALGGPFLGVQDAWLARHDAAGNTLWKLQIGTSAYDDAFALAADDAGGVYIAGETSGSLGGPFGGGGSDFFLARYDADGEGQWIRQSGASGYDVAFALAPDAAGGVFVADYMGYFGSTSNIRRYDAVGTQLWSRPVISSTNLADPYAATPDGTGGVFVAGWYAPPFQQPDVYLARFDGQGNQHWLPRLFGTNAGDRVRCLAPDGAGGVFLAGDTDGSLGGPSAGASDGWLARYDSAGNQSWIRQFGTGAPEYGRGLAADGAGGAWIGGGTGGALAWLARYDAAGTQTWIHPFGTSTWDEVMALAPADSGGFFAAGVTAGSLGGSSADAWLARYTDTCYPDCNTDTQLTVADFGCFQTKFVAADPYADCNGDGQLTVADFGCFQTRFVAGCP